METVAATKSLVNWSDLVYVRIISDPPTSYEQCMHAWAWRLTVGRLNQGKTQNGNGNGNENISNAPPTVDRRRIT